jgi:hypothetical protein
MRNEVAAQWVSVVEQDFHYLGAGFRVRFTIFSIHVILAPVANIMQKEGRPKARISGKSIKLLPTGGYEERVQEKAVCSKQHRLSSDSHV